MKIPPWLLRKRHDTCQRCEIVRTCQDKQTLLDAVPVCSLAKLHPLVDEIRWRQAWPEGADAVSGCCDSALHSPS